MDAMQNNWAIMTALPLVLCSVIALSLIMERWLCIYRARYLNSSEKKQLIASISSNDFSTAKLQLENRNPFYIQACKVLFDQQFHSKIIREEMTTLVLNKALKKLRHRLTAIITIGSLAPMLGLLGTIIGLMRSFHDIGLSTGPVEPSIVADGLWQALSTTAAGMVIAVVCVCFSALLRSRIRFLSSEASEVLTHLSLQFEHNPNVGDQHDSTRL